MDLLPPLTRRAVLAATKEFDSLGRDRFLEKYGFKKATTYFLIERHRPYDAKAIVGAAYGFLPARRAPLTWKEFGSREVTTKQWLEALDFKIVKRQELEETIGRHASELLDAGNLYSRAQLKKLFNTSDATIMTGVFRPSGYRSVCLFVTERKTADRTPFKDALRGDKLYWQGQLSGRTDEMIISHAEHNVELLLFYRRDRYEFPEAAFRYEGVFRYVSKRGAHPTSFILERKPGHDPMADAEDAAEKHHEFDPKNVGDARQRIAATIARRRGQRQFRATLLRAYGRRCAVTKCDYAEVLEAAHIYPYRGERTNDIRNGLLLRADIHTLFDLGWIAIEPAARKVVIHPLLKSTAYGTLAGKRVTLPRRAEHHPSSKALEWHLAQSRVGKLIK